MQQFLIPAAIALFAWWFSTGLILLLDRLPRRTFIVSMLGAGAVLLLSAYGLVATRDMTTIGGAYLAFACGLMAWGFLEMTFLMGVITGPRRTACPAGCGGWRHFRHGIEAILYHELAIIAAALLVLAITWDSANRIGTWTFLILWTMRQSAKLNLFLGVPNTSEEFLPDHLRYLGSYFRRRPMNPLFPLSITGGTIVAVLLVQRAATATTGFDATGYSLLAALMALALIEHWFMLLPFKSSALWGFVLDVARGGSPAAGRSDPEPRRNHWRRESPAARAPVP